MLEASIQKVKNGDTEAFRFIVSEHKDDAYTLAYSVVKDESLAKDIAQVAFIKAYQKLDSFRGESQFSTWFYRIVINEAFNLQRNEEKKTQILEMVFSDEDSEEMNVVYSGMEQENQKYFIQEALKELPRNYSLALHLFYLKEFNLKEISQITGWSGANVRVTLHRARNEMKQLLTKNFKINKEDLYE